MFIYMLHPNRGCFLIGTKDELIHRLLIFEKEHNEIGLSVYSEAPEEVEEPAEESEEIMEIEETEEEPEEFPLPLSEQDAPSAVAAPKQMKRVVRLELDVGDENLPPTNSLPPALASPNAESWKGGRQLMSPIRAIAKQASASAYGELSGVTSTGILSEEQMNHAYNQRFRKPGF
ncbi:hypothetical protein EON65_24915 [archaeon]|nr:MAG: hypothetical protein EON65_24915 [archaeon]